jgi:hypothetical protein
MNKNIRKDLSFLYAEKCIFPKERDGNGSSAVKNGKNKPVYFVLLPVCTIFVLSDKQNRNGKNY